MAERRVTDDQLRAYHAERDRWFLERGQAGGGLVVGREELGRKRVLFAVKDHDEGLKTMDRESIRAGIAAAIGIQKRR